VDSLPDLEVVSFATFILIGFVLFRRSLPEEASRCEHFGFAKETDANATRDITRANLAVIFIKDSLSTGS
jgi:hypothetical protein